MSDNKEGIMVILSSPSGAGKTTLVKKIEENKDFSISISHTTRKPRKNENDGVDYFFVSKSEFENLIKNNKFLEYARVFNNYYGSSEDLVFQRLNNGKNVIFDIDWQGTQQIQNKKLKYKLITIFILPPSREELFKRLLNRETGDEKVANQRMVQFKNDIQYWKNYDYVVINDDLEKCYNQISSFIDRNKKSDKIQEYNSEHIRQHIKKLLQ
tara:strand:+ start:1737 stop:2372 length:636 start_codon:yes stop_codon:yes gene_type:complete